MLKDDLKNLLIENADSPNLYKRNLLKEYLQIYVLDFVYSHENYKDLVFYGGSCLSQCYNLPRLSEDLDFVDIEKKIVLEELARDLEKHFKEKLGLKVTAKKQKFRIYLKFPILEELGLADIKRKESDLLFLKVEVFNAFDFCGDYKIKIKPLFKYNKSLFVRIFDLETLMSTKLRAILNRKWEKTDKDGNVLISVKGRDYFDFVWYLEKGVKPNLNCIEVDNMDELKKKLLVIVENIDVRSVKLDLENFIDDKNYLQNLSLNLKEILKNGIFNL